VFKAELPIFVHADIHLAPMNGTVPMALNVCSKTVTCGIHEHVGKQTRRKTNRIKESDEAYNCIQAQHDEQNDRFVQMVKTRRS
jgi:hypothetical protein